MSTPTIRKPLSSNSNASPRRMNEISPGRPPSADTTVAAGVGSGLARTPSFRQSRLSRRSVRMSTSLEEHDLEAAEEARSAHAQLVSQMDQMRQEIEQLRQDLEITKYRLDDSSNQQAESEERELRGRTEINRLQAEIKELARQQRVTNAENESDHQMLLREKDRLEVELAEEKTKVARLNERIRDDGLEKTYANRLESPTAGPQTLHEPPDQKDQRVRKMESRLKDQDTVIETLQFELAEIHLNGTQESQHDKARVQALEQEVSRIKVDMAKVTEENGHFEAMLTERTLNGSFVPETPVTALSSLAEELGDFDDDDPEAQPQLEVVKKLEAEIKRLTEANKAINLYVDKIIGRILQHEGFEHIIMDNKEAPQPPAKPAPVVARADKALPPPPGVENNTPPSAAAGFLQRAKSVVSRNNATRPSRPMSFAQPVPSANENPETAPSIPLNRGHRRARSDQAQKDLGAAAVVQQMNRGSPLRTVSGGPMSPGIRALSPSLAEKGGYFPSVSQTSTRAPSASQQGERASSRNSITSEHSQEHSSTDASSAQAGPPSVSAGPSVAGQNIPGAVMKQNQLRPLRLVQAQSQEDDDARKRANRGSWMGWFNRSAVEGQHDENLR